MPVKNVALRKPAAGEPINRAHVGLCTSCGRYNAVKLQACFHRRLTNGDVCRQADDKLISYVLLGQVKVQVVLANLGRCVLVMFDVTFGNCAFPVPSKSLSKSILGEHRLAPNPPAPGCITLLR